MILHRLCFSRVRSRAVVCKGVGECAYEVNICDLRGFVLNFDVLKNAKKCMKICVCQKKVVLLQRGIVRAWQARAIRVAV